jgi:D-lactate dehydrogenase (cytochrome)
MIEPLRNLDEDALNHLRSIVGEEHVSISSVDLDQHSHDESFHEAHQPAAVVWPGSTKEISAVLSYANQRRIPVTPWGAGTSLEGNPIPVLGGIVLDTLRMDKILEVRVRDFQVDVQAGTRYKDMNAALARHGLFFAPDPGANASIGGMIANNASGTRTLRYGSTSDNVLRLQVVLPSGKIIHTGTRSAKTASGYDLKRLFVGSEGTLGVVCEATLHLAPVPDKFSAVIASFSSPAGATNTVSAIMGSGIVPAALEFLDLATIRALNASGEFELPEHPTLLMEFHGTTDDGLAQELSEIKGLCEEEGCLGFKAGLGRQVRDQMWRARHQNYEILVRSNPGTAFLIVDVAVPVSQYPRLVQAAEEAFAAQDLQACMVGHAGDGNLHPLVPYTPGDAVSHEIALAAQMAIVEAAISLGGTATGEHGVGIGKRRFMALEHGESLNLMRAIKETIDPNGILNPGKIF